MPRLDKVLKPWKQSAGLNAYINLYGFWNETTFLTKSGDVGKALRVSGVDYESLDHFQQEYAVKRLEVALKAFGPGFDVYQYLFKSSRPEIPFASYDDPVVGAAIDQRRKFFEARRDHLYQIDIFYCLSLEGHRSKTGIVAALAGLQGDPAGAIGELKSQFSNETMKTMLRSHIERDMRRLNQHVEAFTPQLADFVRMEVLDRQGQFTFFHRLLNYDNWRIAGRPQSTQFLDYQVLNSDIAAERDHLRVGEHVVRILTVKEAITETRPVVLDALLNVPANFHVVTEWTQLPMDRARREGNKRRRHFNMSKTGFVSQMGADVAKTNPRDVLESKSARRHAPDDRTNQRCRPCGGDRLSKLPAPSPRDREQILSVAPGAALACELCSRHADDNFALTCVYLFVSRLMLGHGFGATPAPGGTGSSASLGAPLRDPGSSRNKSGKRGKEYRANFFRAPPRKQTFGTWEPGPLARLRPRVTRATTGIQSRRHSHVSEQSHAHRLPRQQS